MKQKIAGTILVMCGVAADSLLYAQFRPRGHDWPVYGGGLESNRYSSLKQIDRTNVHRLEVAWTFDAADGPGGLETNPIVVNETLYANTPKHKVFALEAATGKPRWMFYPRTEGRGPHRST